MLRSQEIENLVPCKSIRILRSIILFCDIRSWHEKDKLVHIPMLFDCYTIDTKVPFKDKK